MNTARSYPVFEADQVLTSTHLNDMLNYLEQQDRLTRIKLIGSGIVCGLEVSFQEKESISVSKGCGLTSQGYLITLCDSRFTHMIRYRPPDFPEDLLMISQCRENLPKSIPFYRNTFSEGVYHLLTAEQYKDLKTADKQKASALSDLAEAGLKKFIVVLFLETQEVKLKNCDTSDCNDKGSRMDLEVKALLVEKAVLEKLVGQKDRILPSGRLSMAQKSLPGLKRYNVPAKNLRSADEVLEAFAALADDVTLKSIADILNSGYEQYSYLLEKESVNPFETLYVQLKKLKEDILVNNPVLIQYFCDFTGEVLKAGHEFNRKAYEISASCCGEEMKYPFHLMLGEAAEDTEAFARSPFRDYFIFSPLFNNQEDKLAEVRHLFTRLKLLTEEVDFDSISDYEKLTVKITPSQYGTASLSDRCIPYHYRVTGKENEFYRYWNYERARHDTSHLNLGYHAFRYTSHDQVVNPLLYDIERFNFFRIEGHIGKNITQAVSTVKSIQQQNNLPFECVALSADYIGALVRGEEPKCILQDLESDFRILIAGFLCRVHDGMCFAARLPFKQMEVLLNYTVAGFKNTTKEDATIIKNSLTYKPPVAEKANRPLTSAVVSEIQASGKYTKGDTLSKLCNPDANTIGSAYFQMKGVFVNPVNVDTDKPLTSVWYHAFELIDAIESILGMLMNNDLADITTQDLKSNLIRFEKAVRIFGTYITLFRQALEKKEDNSTAGLAAELNLEVLVFNLENLLNTCLVEQIEALKSEYLRRTAQFRLARNFSYYLKSHGGMEHKAGVPFGGTFILVYHEERNNRVVDKNALFISAELGNLMASRFSDLIAPEKSAGTLMEKTEMLQAAILYKDPEMYVKFNDVFKEYLVDTPELTIEKRKKLTDILNREPNKKRFKLADGMVIADFYIPYICCSDCPPVAYILPEKQSEPAVDPVIKMEKNTFCSDDKNSYPVVVTPKDGVMTGKGIITTPEGSYLFVPETAGSGVHSLAWTSNGKTASLQATVILKPVAKFSFTTTVENAEMKVMLKNETADLTDATKCEWYINGKGYSEKCNPDPIVFKTATLPRTILLKVTNEICTGEFSQVISKPETEERKITLCWNVKRHKLEPNLTTTDVVSVLKNDGIKMRDATLEIMPASTTITETSEFHVSYLINGKQVDVTITLVFTDAGFLMKLSRNTSPVAVFPVILTLNAKLKDAEKYTWKITSASGRVLNFSTREAVINYTQSQVSAGEQLTIQLAVSKTDASGTTCESSSTFILTEAITARHLNQGEFDNLTTA